MTNYPDVRGEHDDTLRAPRTEEFVEVINWGSLLKPFKPDSVGRALRQVKPVIMHVNTPGLVKPSHVERQFKAGRPDD